MTDKVVFVADDDPTFTKLMELVLKNYGLKSQTFSSYEEVYKALEKTTPALCFFDLNFGTTNKGIELVQKVRADISKILPIFVVSSTSDPKIIAHAIEVGANDYLFKPLERDTLIAKIQSYVKTPELDRAPSKPQSAGSKLPANVIVDVTLDEIDELGITVSSKHLVSKGTVLAITGTLVNEILGKEGKLLVTTVSNAAVGDKKFKAYLEFDSAQESLQQQVRNWLAKQPA